MFKKGMALTLAAVLCLSLSIGGLSVRAEDALDPSAPVSTGETTAQTTGTEPETQPETKPVQKTLLQRLLDCESIGSMKKLYNENQAAVKAMSRADLNKIITHHNQLAEKEKAQPIALLKLPAAVDPSSPTVPETTVPETVDPSDPTVPETTVPETVDPSDPTVPETTVPETVDPSDPTVPETTVPETVDPSDPTVPETTEPVLTGEALLASLLSEKEEASLTAAFAALTQEQLDSLTQEQLAQVDHARQMFQARSIYERFAACTTMPEFDSIRLTEEETALMAQFFQENPEEKAVILNLIDTLPPAPTKNFTAAGPLLSTPQMVAMKPTLYNASRDQTYKAPEAQNGLFLDKKAKPNGDGTYTVTLEAYTTGKVVTQEVARPIDIVLVLDYSESMERSFGKGIDRLTAMKNAVNIFIDKVHDQYSEQSDHQIAVVPFYEKVPRILKLTKVDDAGVKVIKNFVKNQGVDGLTNTGLAMEEAAKLLKEDGREKVVILFTDGSPESSGGEKFNVNQADRAVFAAKGMKAMNATVYTVGIMSGADASVVDNGMSKRGTWNTWTDATISFNRFLNYTSSNFPMAENVGLNKSRKTYSITKNADRAHSIYYLTANNADALNDIFINISEQIGTPSIDLGPTTVVKDVMSQYFDVPENAQSVKFYTSDYNGSSFEKKRTPIDLTATIQGDTISVTGYDFNANFVSETAKKDGTFGQKLIMEFTCSPKEGFLGGDGVPTNDPSSGIYVPGKQEPLRPFPEPHVDVPVVPITLDLPDGYVYYGGTVAQKKLNDLITVKAGDLELDLNAKKEGHFGLSPENAWKADYIDLSTSTDHGSFQNMTTPLDYTINVTIRGDESSTSNREEAGGTGHIDILTPQVTWKDSWLQGGSVPDYMAQNYVKTEWLCWTQGSTDGMPVEPETIVDTRSAPPALTFAYSPAEKACFRDTPVKVTVSLDGRDFTGLTHFAHVACPKDTNCRWGQPGFDDCQFIVHVNSFDLVLTKTVTGGVSDPDDVFIFWVTVESQDRLHRSTMTVTLKAGETVTIRNVPIGSQITVTESSSWSQDYEAPAFSNGFVPSDIQDGRYELTIENTRRPGPLTASAEVDNRWVTTPTK